jgi:PAS domain S-box-containing protein
MESSGPLRILIVEDNPGDFFLVGEYLREGPWQLSITHAQRLGEAMTLARTHEYDLILLDLTLPDSSGMESVKVMRPFISYIPVIVLTGMGDEQFGMDSLKLGAQDYLVKDQINGPLLVKSVRYSLERSRVRQAMSKQDRLFRVITENSPTAKALIKPDGTIIFCTNSVKAILGFEAAKVQGKNENEIIHPEDFPAFQEAIQQVLANPDQQPQLELRMKNAEGDYRWCQKGLANMLHDEQVNALVCTFWDITERRIANERIASSERRLSALVRSGSDLIWILDDTGKFQYISPTSKPVLGFEPEFLWKKDYLEFVHEEDIPGLQESFRQLMNGTEITAAPFRFRNAKGEWRWIETEMLNLLNDAAVNGLVFNSRDITEKLKAENELRRLSLIARETTNAVVITDRDGRIIWVNSGFTNITGYGFREAMGKTPGSFLQGPKTDLQTVAYMRERIRNQQPFEVEIINYSKEGKEYWLRIQCQPIFNKDRELEQFFAIETDITESKNSQYLLKQSEERYRSLFEVSPASILVWDPDSKRILQVNMTAEREYGYNRDEFCNLTISSILAEQTFMQQLCAMVENMRKGIVGNNKGLSRRIRRDGEVIVMEHAAHLVSFNGSEAVLLLEQNVTEKLELEATLEAERLARQQVVTDAVISAQEHERREIGIELHDNINQILASARLYLGLVKSVVKENGNFIEETDKLINSAIHEIRNLSHALIPPSLNESALLEALDHIIASTRKTSGLDISRSYHQLDESLMSDKLKLTIYRIVQEQFNNILKYANANSVTVHLQKVDDRIQLRIADDGVGFDVNQQRKGVGLMNMKTRASLFNGELHILSAPGKGCELTVEMDCEGPEEE